MAWNACEQMEGCKYCATPIIMEFTYWIWAARKLALNTALSGVLAPQYCVSSLSAASCGKRLAHKVLFPCCRVWRSAFFLCLYHISQKMYALFAKVCDIRLFLRQFQLHFIFEVFCQFTLDTECFLFVEVKTTQSSAYRKLYFGVTPAHFSRLESLRLYLHRRCGSIYQRPTYQSKSFR